MSEQKLKELTKKQKLAKQNSETQKLQEYLSGTIERVTFHSVETGFSVLKVKSKGHRDLVTVVGSSVSVTAGEYIDCSGKWINNREYGQQFQAENIRIVLPSTIEGIEKYLGSGLVKGIGPHFAKVLVKAFGENVFQIIEESPDKLKTLPGIGEIRRERIIKSWNDQKVIRDIVVFLQSHGVGTARAVRIYKTYGNEAINKVRENPYRLALDIRGIGFKTADLLAQRLGIEKNSVLRAEAGVKHVLQELCSQGHTAIAKETLIQETIKVLEIEESLVHEAILRGQAENHFVVESFDDDLFVFLKNLHRAEVGVVQELRRIMKVPSMFAKAFDFHSLSAVIKNNVGIDLSLSQQQALSLALQHKITIITGGPGVGKTTLVKAIIHLLSTKTKDIKLCAPTGRAAKRLSESTGMQAKTLHRLLEFDPKTYGFRRNETYPLEAEVLVVDEMSMVDLPMMHHLLKSIPDVTQVILVGDVDQLPSVGPGAVLTNLIDSQIIPVVRLTEIFRQAKTSEIILSAHQINKGHLPKLHYAQGEISDFYFIEANTKEEIQEKLMQVVVERIPKRFKFDPIREIQVLVPMNKGFLGVRSLNVELQKKLNLNPGQQITRFGWNFSVKDKVIQTINNYDKEIFNGDIGFISKIDLEESRLLIDFDGRSVVYEIDELDEIALAYATTIHKAQGSEYPAVVIPIAMEQFSLLEKNLLYTGVTRGKSLVVLIGQPRALGMAVRTIRSSKRITHLAQRLSDTT